jgi:predicted phosphodiesterase
MAPVLRRVARIAAPILVGIVGALAGLVLWGRTSVSMGPFQVLLTGRVGRGVTVIALPPFGRVTADTHLAPLRFTATLQGVRIEDLAKAVGDQGTEALIDQVRLEALKQVTPFAIRLFLAGMAGTLILALIAFRTRWRQVGIALLTTTVLLGGSEALAWRTYDQSSLLTPSFSGSLALAPELIGPAETAIDRIDDFRAELSRILNGAVRLYTQVQGVPSPAGDEIRVLHISDIHLSPLGFTFARDVAAAFDVAFVIDTGDLTSFGTPIEDDLIRTGVAAIGKPYVFVRGNHDSLALQNTLAEIPGVVVLDGQARQVGGLSIFGAGDPVFTPNRLAVLDDEAIAQRVRAAGNGLLVRVSALPEPPDVVAVHDDRMAEAMAGHVPLVVSGHFHQPSARVMNGTVYLRIGSTGGAGANVFTQAGGVPLSAEVLYFSPDEPHRLIAYDLIEQSPESGSLVVRRHLIGQDFGNPVPSPSPSESPPGSPSISPSVTPAASV